MASSRQYLFGEYCLDAEQRALFRRGEMIALTPKCLETLLFLVERQGKITDKQELMEAVWPGTFVEEASLTRNVSVLRKILSDGEDGRFYIETIPKRGYRFVAPVEEARENGGAPAHALRPPEELRGSLAAANRHESWWHSLLARRRLILVTASTALVLGSTAALAFRPRDAVPSVSRSLQVTSFGRASDPLAVSADRLFLGIHTGGSRQVAQMPAALASPTTEEPLILPTSLPKPRIFDISADGSELLVGAERSAGGDLELWVMRTAGGAPRRLGSLTATGAGWSPDGKHIVFTAGAGVYVANNDGTETRKLTDVSGAAIWPRWSPDGRMIRFTAEDLSEQPDSIWEISPSGGTARRLFASLSRDNERWTNGVAFGNWTADGRYFYFVVTRHVGYERAASLWVVRESRNLLGGLPAPKRIFESPLVLGPPIPSRDGKRLFFTAHQEDRELLKYDSQQKRFISWLGGIPVASIHYSSDGLWVAYGSFPDGVLWRARADGSEAVKLAESPAVPYAPVFSPDGKSVLYCDGRIARGHRIYLVPRDGGSPVQLTSGDDSVASWFPDSGTILYRHWTPPGEAGGEPRGFYRIDVSTGKKERMPGSEGKVDPGVSPDGQYVLAVTEDYHRLTLFDVVRREWRDIATGQYLRSPNWSRDSQYVYFQDYYEGREQPIYRVHLPDGHIEKVATSAQFQRSDVFHGYFFEGLAPDGQPMVSLLRNKSDVYALELSQE